MYRVVHLVAEHRIVGIKLKIPPQHELFPTTAQYQQKTVLARPDGGPNNVSCVYCTHLYRHCAATAMPYKRLLCRAFPNSTCTYLPNLTNNPIS